MSKSKGANLNLPCMRHRFFEDYKKNENKEVKVDEILGRDEALKAIKDAMVRRCCTDALTRHRFFSPYCCTRTSDLPAETC